MIKIKNKKLMVLITKGKRRKKRKRTYQLNFDTDGAFGL